MQIQADPNQKKNQRNRVKVAIRVRPMVSRQIANNDSVCVDFQLNNQIILGNQRSFKFDRVFSDNSKQSQVYTECVHDLVLSCFDGYNAAILAYGQTGSGKTFTMGTASNYLTDNVTMGIIPRVIQDIFSQIDKRKNKSKCTVKASFIQIYNEQIIDLLSPDANKVKNKQNNGVTIRQQKDGSVSIYGVIEQHVTQTQKMVSLLQKGGLYRTTSCTLMNDASSRSHAIFTIFIEQQIIENNDKKEEKSDEEGFITAKFFFVDLAGSQRAKKTGATGATLKQGININLGLLQLGNVISSLASVQKKQSTFITYRNSKLTRILQDCLGGNSNTYMIACVSPAQSNIQQSLNTLKYAAKAMNIKNKPVINRDPQSALISQLKQKIAQLQLQNRKLRQVMTQNGVNVEQQLNQSKDIITDELRRLKSLYINVEKKLQIANAQLKQQKKKKNQFQIDNYEIKRERDLLKLQIQEAKKVNPALFINEDASQGQNKLSLLEEYLNKIQNLENQLNDKDKLLTQLQQEFDKMHKMSQKDQRILLEKNKKIYQITKQNQSYKKQIEKLKRQIEGHHQNNPLKQHLNDCTQSFENEKYDSQQQEMQEMSEDVIDQQFEKMTKNTYDEMIKVNQCLEQRQNFLNSMSNNQIQLEYQLISDMKEQYHHKIMILEKQKLSLIKNKDEVSSGTQKSKFVNRIDSLETQLKQYRKKIKEQKNAEKVVATQNQRIKILANQIKQFKVQKIELARKLKEDKQNFVKFKIQKTKDIMKVKREGIKKQNQLKKVTFQNKKNVRTINRKDEEIKRMKRVNQSLKAFLKPSINKKKQTIPKEIQSAKQLATNQKQKNYDQIIKKALKGMLYQIDRNIDLQRYENKITQVEVELQQLLHQQSKLKINLQRIKLDQQATELIQAMQQQQLTIGIMDLRQRMVNCEENLDFCRNKYDNLCKNTVKQYDIDAEIIYNKNYDSIESLRQLLGSLFRSTNSVLAEDYHLKDMNDKKNSEIKLLKNTISQLKEQIMMITSQHQQNLFKLRQQLIMRQYSYDQQQFQGPTQFKTVKLDQRQKKMLDKKIIDLTKTNKQLSIDVEMWRRKCNVLQQKYQNMKLLCNKDRFIGRPKDKQDQNTSKDKKNASFNNSKNAIMMDEVNQMLDQFSLKIKKSKDQQTQNMDKQIQQLPQSDFNTNKWQCLGKIDAHNSPILSLATHANLLISTATKSMKIWDVETSKVISDLSGPHLSGFVRCVIVNPQRKIMATACDKTITIWDLATLNVQGVLKGHKDQIRTMHIMENFLFSAGKGTNNSGGLLGWDFRYLNPNSPNQQKQKSQDIFTMTSCNNILYYGTRNHQVRRMSIQNMQTLAPFEPPHMDTVTGMTVVKDYLISGSKDKNLRLWSLDSTINNIKDTLHAFNDYITTVQSDPYLPIFYSGSRDGQIKVGAINKDKIDVIGGIMAHTQSVNAICPIQMSNQNQFATGSSDKTIKLWQPSMQTINHMQNQSI